MKRVLLLGFFALTMLTSALAIEVGVRFGPPPPPREIVVARPSPRHVWVPGLYRWDGRHYVWVKGYWTYPPRGRSEWIPGRWDRHNGMHVWVEGRWR
jgi:hypothetical protein